MQQKAEKHTVDLVVQFFLLVLLAAYGLACVYLYYQQLFYVEGGLFESDLPSHVKMAVEDHWFYSLTAILYQLFYLTPWGPQLTTVFLGAVTVATVLATERLLRLITEEKYARNLTLLLAFLANLLMPFFFSWAHFQRYIGYQSASIWHNSTYICMKLLGVLTFCSFLRLEAIYREKTNWKEWLSFAGLLVLCNGIKPSFCMMFAPAMAVFLLCELFRKVPFRKVFIFGSAVLPSLFVILWQNMVLFGDNTGNGIVFAPGYALSMRGTHPKVTFLLSIAFPLLILLFTLKHLEIDGLYRFGWLMWLFGFLEVFLFSEAGNRAKDSNFFWGYSMAIFFVNLFAMWKLVEINRCRKGIWARTIIRRIVVFMGVVCLSYQAWCGIYFFMNLLKGKSYWM